jgi:hypothetical protein
MRVKREQTATTSCRPFRRRLQKIEVLAWFYVLCGRGIEAAVESQIPMVGASTEPHRTNGVYAVCVWR